MTARGRIKALEAEVKRLNDQLAMAAACSAEWHDSLIPDLEYDTQNAQERELDGDDKLSRP